MQFTRVCQYFKGIIFQSKNLILPRHWTLPSISALIAWKFKSPTGESVTIAFFSNGAKPISVALTSTEAEYVPGGK